MEKRVIHKALLMFLAVFAVVSNAAVVCADDIGAKAAVAFDATADRILYAKNPNLKVPPASTTKLLTSMVVLDRLNPDSIITVSANAASIPSVSPRLRKGDRFAVRDLLSLALMRSINGATVALAEAVAGSEDGFTRLMNEKAVKIGAENSVFINASGLPGPGQHVTAYDLAKVMKASLDYPLLKEIINTRTAVVYTLDGRRLFLKNTNQLLWSEEDLIGGKTGYTKEARHCFVCAAKRGESTLISVVLGERVRDNLWEDSKTLLAKGVDVLNKKAEPMIYLSTEDTGPIVFATYSKPAKNKAKKKIAHNKNRKSKGTKLANAKQGKTQGAAVASSKKIKKKRSNLSAETDQELSRRS
ncbi:MAG: D-alanyl-D-alanine carboxypeptidase [Nitrospirae bacterium]|nr:D-alanyl-D-alanine carboxypeptidase [Nitrospirota bacterium]